MEREFKWDAFGALQDAVLMWALNRDADSAKLTEMDARYFDTADGALSAEKTALRLRRENEDCICCLKLRGGEVTEDGLHAHAEYECKATCIAEGLAVLPELGAPIELCSRLRAMKLAEICRIAFSRYTVMLRQDGASAELALDRGRMTVGDRVMPLCEIELEYKGGPEEGFLAMGEMLMDEFRLRPQPLSKLARARMLAEMPEKPQRPPRPPEVTELIELPEMPGTPEPPVQYIPSEAPGPTETAEQPEAPEPTEAPEVSEAPGAEEQTGTAEQPEAPEPSEESEPFEQLALQELTDRLKPAKTPEPSETPETSETAGSPGLLDGIALPDLSELRKASGAPDSEPPPHLPKLLGMLKILEKKE